MCHWILLPRIGIPRSLKYLVWMKNYPYFDAGYADAKVVPPKKPFIQILLVANCHWAVCPNNDTKVGGCHDSYESGRPTCLSTKVKETICSFYKCKANTTPSTLTSFEGQMNSYDCGSYAVAIATEPAFKNDPTLCRWDCPKMRPHLLQCLENGKMSRFPTFGKI